MTAKEKAKELYGKFLQFDFDGDKGWVLNIEESKETAQKVINEITSALTNYGEENMEIQNMDREFSFWDKVVTELMNL